MATTPYNIQVPFAPPEERAVGFGDPQVQNIADQLEQQRQESERANRVLVGTIQQGAQQLGDIDKAYGAAVTALSSDAQGLTSEALDAYGNIQKVIANPLLEFVGIFNPKYNQDYQANRLQQTQFQMTAVNARQEQLTAMRNNARQQVTDSISFADKNADAIRSGLVNTQIQYQTVAMVMEAQLKQLNVQLAGMTDEELKAARKNSLLPKGLLDEKINERKKEQLAIEAARLANQAAGMDISTKSLGLAEKKREEFLRVASDSTLDEMIQMAQENNNIFSDPEQPNLKFSMQELRTAKIKKMEESRANDAKWVNYAMASSDAHVRIGAAGDQMLRLGMMATADPKKVIRQTVIAPNGQEIPLSNINPESLPIEARVPFAQLQNYMAVVVQAEDAELANTAIVEGAKKIDELNKAVEAYTKDLPKERRNAAQEFIRTGQVRSASSAADVVATTSLNVDISAVSNFALTGYAAQVTQAINNIESQSFGRTGTKTYTSEDVERVGGGDPKMTAADLIAALKSQKAARDNTELVRQANASLPAPPVQIIMSQVEQAFLSQVVNKLAQEQPDIWSGMFAKTGTQGPMVGLVQDASGNSTFSKVEFLREIERRQQRFVKEGKLPAESSMAETLFSLLQANAEAFVDATLTPTDDISASYLTTAGLSDPAERRRFFMNQILSYPPKYREAQTLEQRSQQIQQDRLGSKGLPPGTIGGPSLRFGK